MLRPALLTASYSSTDLLAVQTTQVPVPVGAMVHSPSRLHSLPLAEPSLRLLSQVPHLSLLAFRQNRHLWETMLVRTVWSLGCLLCCLLCPEQRLTRTLQHRPDCMYSCASPMCCSAFPLAPGRMHLGTCTWAHAPGHMHLGECTWAHAPGHTHCGHFVCGAFCLHSSFQLPLHSTWHAYILLVALGCCVCTWPVFASLPATHTSQYWKAITALTCRSRLWQLWVSAGNGWLCKPAEPAQSGPTVPVIWRQLSWHSHCWCRIKQAARV